MLSNNLFDNFLAHGTTTFMHDSASCHTAKTGKTLLSNNINVLEWLGNSPDINPIENAWKVMKGKVQEAKSTSLPQLQQITENVWYNKMDLQYFTGLVESMPHKIAAVIKANENMTKY